MREEEIKFNLVINKLNSIVNSSTLYHSLVRVLIAESRVTESIYWSLRQTALTDLEDDLDGISISAGKGDVKCSASGLLKRLNSMLFVYCMAAGISHDELINLYVLGMERSVGQLGITAETILALEETKSRMQLLRNQTWLFTLCLLEYSVYNVDLPTA